MWMVLYDAKGYVVNVCNKICDKGGLRTRSRYATTK